MDITKKDSIKNNFYKSPVFMKIFFGSIAIIFLFSIIALGWYYRVRNTSKSAIKVNNTYIGTAKSCGDITKMLARDVQTKNIGVNAPLGMSIEAGEATTADTTGGSSDYSKTNVQVEGVDEADTVKNDGEYIYTVRQGNIDIVKAYPAEDAKLVKTIKVVESNNTDASPSSIMPEEYTGSDYGNVSQLFIAKNRLLAIGNKTVTKETSTNNSIIERFTKPYNPSTTYTFIKIWDTSNKTNPKLTRSVEYEGNYSAGRMIGDNVHLVLNTYPNYNVITPQTDALSLLPKYSDVQGSAKAVYKPTCGCADVEYFKNVNNIEDKTNNTFVSVVSLSIKDETKEINRRTIIGNSDIVYASSQNLYLASLEQPIYTNYTRNTVSKTQFHKFKLVGNNSEYLSSASIEGSALNQYSMDESNGFFRVAATKGSITDTVNKSTNNIYVFNGDMKQVGALEDLAPGEEIYSARFMGDRGYLVTFKKVDPFYVIDLKDPEKPAVLGYLKIPGYSDYLHPYDENHIIGIGKEAIDASTEAIESRNLDFAWYQGVKMAIFDVTDVTNPKEMFKTVIGDRGTDSPVLTDPKAFLFDKAKSLLSLPISLAELTPEQKASTGAEANTYGTDTFQGAYVYKVDLEKGFQFRDRITHKTTNENSKNNYSYDYAANSTISRILYIGDILYTISDSMIQGHKLSDISKVAEVKFN
ncbi:MAG: beta-propeller domain-containing protein [bacterium]